MPALTARVLEVACAVLIMSAACGSRALTPVEGSAGGGASGGASGGAGGSASGAAGGGAAGSTGGATGVAGTGGSTPSCANVGCALPPLCSEGCREPCGCCACAAGTRMGDLVCVGGCYGPAVATDAGPDASAAQDAGPADRPPGDWTPPDRCLLPFDPGPCDGSVRVFAFVNGACVQQGYGGCQGNANRFSTLEECLATCEGRPDPRPCPTGRVVREILRGLRRRRRLRQVHHRMRPQLHAGRPSLPVDTAVLLLRRRLPDGWLLLSSNSTGSCALKTVTSERAARAASAAWFARTRRRLPRTRTRPAPRSHLRRLDGGPAGGRRPRKSRAGSVNGKELIGQRPA